MALLAYWPPAAHVILLAACAATGWWRLDTAPILPSNATEPARSDAPMMADGGEATDESTRDWQGDVETVATRALFRPGRQVTADVPSPQAPIAPSGSGSEAPLSFEALRMVGYLDEGGRRSAILETVEDGQSHIVREGEEIAGARVREIDPGAVVIEAAGQEFTVKLYPD